MKLPKHECELILTHNRHKTYYETAQQYIEAQEKNSSGLVVWKNPESRQRSMDTNEIWELQWYPNTPIGFHLIQAPTLEELLEFAQQVDS